MTPLQTLRALGTGSEAPVQAKQRVYSALLLSLEAAAGTAAAGATASAVPKAPVTVPPVMVPPAPLIAGLASGKTLAIAASIWLMGGATGAALYGALRPEQVRLVYVERPALTAAVSAPANSSPAAATAALTPASSVSAVNSTTRPELAQAVPAPTLSAHPSSELARERALLDQARSDAAHGEPALALQETEQHSQQFPHGRLAEEREALAIRALLALGRDAEARQRAQAFHAAYPNSFLSSVIDSALSAP